MAWDDLFKGDCLECLSLIKDRCVDLVLVDLPYGTTNCEWDSVIPLEPLWKQLRRVAKPNAAIVMTCDQPFTTTLIHSNIKEFRYCWTWVKGYSTGFMNANKMPLKNTEDVAIFYRRLPTYNPQGIVATMASSKAQHGTKSDIYNDDSKSFDREHYKAPFGFGLDPNLRKRGNVAGVYDNNGVSGSEYKKEFVNYPRQTISLGKEGNVDKPVHPTQKPLALMSYFIKTYSNPGDTILDCAMGSGTTGIAALALDRNFIGIEKDSEYYGLAKKRIEAARSPFDKFRTRPQRIERTRRAR